MSIEISIHFSMHNYTTSISSPDKNSNNHNITVTMSMSQDSCYESDWDGNSSNRSRSDPPSPGFAARDHALLLPQQEQVLPTIPPPVPLVGDDVLVHVNPLYRSLPPPSPIVGHGMRNSDFTGSNVLATSSPLPGRKTESSGFPSNYMNHKEQSLASDSRLPINFPKYKPFFTRTDTSGYRRRSDESPGQFRSVESDSCDNNSGAMHCGSKYKDQHQQHHHHRTLSSDSLISSVSKAEDTFMSTVNREPYRRDIPPTMIRVLPKSPGQVQLRPVSTSSNKSKHAQIAESVELRGSSIKAMPGSHHYDSKSVLPRSAIERIDFSQKETKESTNIALKCGDLHHSEQQHVSHRKQLPDYSELPHKAVHVRKAKRRQIPVVADSNTVNKKPENWVRISSKNFDQILQVLDHTKAQSCGTSMCNNNLYLQDLQQQRSSDFSGRSRVSSRSHLAPRHRNARSRERPMKTLLDCSDSDSVSSCDNMASKRRSKSCSSDVRKPACSAEIDEGHTTEVFTVIENPRSAVQQSTSDYTSASRSSGKLVKVKDTCVDEDIDNDGDTCAGCVMLRQYDIGEGTVFGIYAKPPKPYNFIHSPSCKKKKSLTNALYTSSGSNAGGDRSHEDHCTTDYGLYVSSVGQGQNIDKSPKLYRELKNCGIFPSHNMLREAALCVQVSVSF